MPVLAGLLMLAIFAFRYASIDSRLYEARDDAVITMSHAKNLVDWGSIGVSPSGERVEGFSTPVEFGVYGIMYGLFGVSYERYSRGQTWVASFLIGFLFAFFLRDRPLFALVATGLASIYLSYCYSFFLWHGSGMENAITHVTFLWAFCVLFHALARGEASGWLAIPVFIASISRVESIYHVGPMVFLFALAFTLRHRDARGIRVFGLFLMAWIALQAIRYAYFGSLVPNTGYAQSIDLGTRFANLLTFDGDTYSKASHFAMVIMNEHAVWILAVVIPLLLFARRSKDLTFLLVVVFVMLLLSFASPFVFGRARLDASRTTTHLPIFIMLAIAYTLHEVEGRRALFAAVPLVALLAFAELKLHDDQPSYLCCSVNRLAVFNDALIEMKEEQQLFRPTVAVAALGLISYEKNFNILDMGYLGSPVVAHLKHENDPAIREYFLEWVAPDLVEFHDNWSCEHHMIFEDPRFARRYEPVVPPVRTRWLENWCKQHPEAVAGYWVRKGIAKGAASKERRLIDALAGMLAPPPTPRADDAGPRTFASPEAAGARILDEIDACAARPAKNACMAVVRTVYRFMPELVAAGQLERIRERLAPTPVGVYSTALLESRERGDWYLDIVAMLDRATASARATPR